MRKVFFRIPWWQSHLGIHTKIIMKKIILLILIFCLLPLNIYAFSSSVKQKDNFMIQIKGSDTMVNLVQALAEEYMNQNPNFFIAITGGGSGTGFASLISGTCDIAMASRTIKPKEIKFAQKHQVYPNEIKIGLDGLAVVVNPKNSISKLTIQQLSDVFSGKITNWQELGGKNEKIVILSREVNSGTHVYFKEHVLRGNDSKSKVEFAPRALMLSSSQAIADEVAQNTAAIGYYGMGYISPKHKTIAVAKDNKSPYIKPTVENVMNGSYPISRPLYLYTNGKPEGQIKAFIRSAFTKEGQKIVVENDFVPIHIPGGLRPPGIHKKIK